jgi:hypothetical protein
VPGRRKRIRTVAGEDPADWIGVERCDICTVPYISSADRDGGLTPHDLGEGTLMTAHDLAWLDATAQAELVRSGELSPSELVEAAIERFEALNSDLNAVITPLFERARELAANGLPDGPFRGVPLLLEDRLAHSAGDPLRGGERTCLDRT